MRGVPPSYFHRSPSQAPLGASWGPVAWRAIPEVFLPSQWRGLPSSPLEGGRFWEDPSPVGKGQAAGQESRAWRWRHGPSPHAGSPGIFQVSPGWEPRAQPGLILAKRAEGHGWALELQPASLLYTMPGIGPQVQWSHYRYAHVSPPPCRPRTAMMTMMSLSPWTETASWMSSSNRWEPAHPITPHTLAGLG